MLNGQPLRMELEERRSNVNELYEDMNTVKTVLHEAIETVFL
jgi:hypothetical protein